MPNRLQQFATLDIFFQKIKLLRWLLRVLLLILLTTALINQSVIQTYLLGIFFISLPLGISLDIFQLFIRSEIGREEKRQTAQLNNDSLTYPTALMLVRSQQNAQRLWYFLLNDMSLQFVALRLGLSTKQLYDLPIQLPTYNEWINQARQQAKFNGHPLCQQDLFEVIQTRDPFPHLWQSLAITDQDRSAVWQWYFRVNEEEKKSKRGFVDTLRLSGGIGRDWASGYTQSLDLYAQDLTKELQALRQPIALVGHSEERKKVLDYLSNTEKHNVILVGEDGIGKQRMVYALASDFAAGTVPMRLKYKHIYQIDVGKLVSSQTQSELEMQLHAVFEEASHVGNVIVIIPDFHLLVGSQKSDTVGSINASPIVSAYLQSPLFSVIGITTPQNYYAFIKPNQAIDPYLSVVEVKEIKAAEALRVLEDELPRYEYRLKHIFTYQALLKIIEIAERHVHDRPYPEKVLMLIGEISAESSEVETIAILPSDVERILGEKFKIPIGNVTNDERQALNSLEQKIQSRVVGQKEAVQVVANALRRARAGLHSGKRPIGSFLFLGPTGVGKTEMAKTVAALYYKNEKAFIRIDMSEYQTPDSIQKLLGTQEKPGMLTTQVTDQPFSVVLLDEIEKADQSVRNIFLQILDDGYVTDGFGRKIDFTNTMVIATSNAGAQYIREAVQTNTIDATFKQKLLDQLQTTGVFPPEWLNRFDAIVTFLPLTRDEIKQIAQLQVAQLMNQLKTHNINLTIDEGVYDVLVERGYDPQFGARPMRRAVQDTLESILAKALLNDTTPGIKNITVTKDMVVA